MAFTASATTTELEAVNVMLMTIGEATVTAIDSDDSYEVNQAQDILYEVVREICQDSYHFNTEYDVSLTSSLVGSDVKIAVTPDIVQFVPNDPQGQYVIRNGYLYDLERGTDVLTVDSVKGTKVYLLNFEDLPEAVKRYALVRAARIYADRLVGSQSIRAFTLQDEIEAKAKLMQYETNTDRLNMITDSYSVAKAVIRRPGKINPARLF